jgi:hypothetical protein
MAIAIELGSDGYWNVYKFTRKFSSDVELVEGFKHLADALDQAKTLLEA